MLLNSCPFRGSPFSNKRRQEEFHRSGLERVCALTRRVLLSGCESSSYQIPQDQSGDVELWYALAVLQIGWLSMNGASLFGQLVGVIVLAFVMILWALGAFKPDPNKWYGKMRCQRCGYQWQSKRRTPPARCPKCNSTGIEVTLG